MDAHILLELLKKMRARQQEKEGAAIEANRADTAITRTESGEGSVPPGMPPFESAQERPEDIELERKVKQLLKDFNINPSELDENEVEVQGSSGWLNTGKSEEE